METGKNNATNNVIIRFWKRTYYEAKFGREFPDWRLYDGTVTGVKSKITKHFHSPAQMLTAIEAITKAEEKL